MVFRYCYSVSEKMCLFVCPNCLINGHIEFEENVKLHSRYSSNIYVDEENEKGKELLLIEKKEKIISRILGNLFTNFDA